MTSPTRARTAATIVIAAVVLSLLIFASDAVLLLFAAILLAVLLRAVSEPLARCLGLDPMWGLVITVTLLLIAFAVIGWSIAPAIGEQIRELRSALPAALQRLQEELSRFAWLEVLLDAARMPHSLAAQPDVAQKVTGAVSNTLAILANIAVVLVIAIYLAADPRPYVEGTVRLFPLARRKRAKEVLLAMGNALRWWLIGKALSMLIVGIVIFIGLSALNVPLAGALALIAGLLDFIPNVGPILALVPAALFALLQGPTEVLYVVVLYAVVQTLEGYLLTPLIERQTVKLPPALTLTVMVIATLLFGAFGLLLAAPATAALLVAVQMVYLEDALGERDAVGD
jgi:predicted PurR-regulated permease PerM